MNLKRSGLYHNLINLKKLQNKTQFSIFLVCLIISIFIWFLIKMSKDYTADISYKLIYNNAPANQIITEIYDSIIYVQIDSRGFDLMNRTYLNKSHPIEIDLRNIPVHKNRYRIGNYILSESILNQIRNQTEFPNQIHRISPDTLFLKLENCISKEVDIKTMIDLVPKKQHYIYGNITQSPLKVLLTGPPSIIDTINSIYSEPIKLENIKDDQHLKLMLLNPYKNDQVSLSVDSVELIIPIQEYTENIAEIPIKINGAANMRLKLFPEKVQVRYLVALKDFERITNDMFSAVINFNIKAINNQQVKLDRFPAFIKIIDYEPKSVEYLILIEND